MFAGFYPHHCVETTQFKEIALKVADLKQKHITLAKENLRIGRCFGTLTSFSEKIAAFRGIAAFEFVVDRSGGDVVSAGSVRVSHSEDAPAMVIGSWSVFSDGKMTVRVGGLLLENEDADPMERGLNRAWVQGDFRRAISSARAVGGH